MTQTFNDVQISGTADVVQLGIKANAIQTNAIQLWQDSGSNPLARITGDGRLQIGNNIVSGPTDALVQANYNPTGMMPTSVWHAPGVLTTSGTVAGTINWVFHELQLAGSSVLTGVQNALYTKLTNSNAGNSGSADLRAATFQAISSGGSGGTPVAKATGARLIASNAASAYLSQAIGVEATVSNDTGGSITSATAFSVAAPTNNGTIGTLYGLQMADLTQGSANYALYTGKGTAHFGDLFEIPVFSSTPAGTPPANFIQVYTKLASGTAQLYAKNSGGVETVLGGANGVTSVGLTMPASVFSVTGSPVTSSGNLTVALATQTANTVLAGPSSGGATAPAFRALTGTDLTAALASPPAIGTATPGSAVFANSVEITGATSTQPFLMFARNGSYRFSWFIDGDSELGGNTGSTFRMGRYSDTGAYIDEPLSVSRSTGMVTTNGLTSGVLNVSGGAGINRAVYYQTNGVNRWFAGAGADGEGGGNTGSNFYISRNNDGGTLIDSPFEIRRDTGNATFLYGLTIGGTVTTQAVGVNVTPTAWLDVGSGASNGLRIRGSSGMSSYFGQVSDLGDFQWRANLGFNATTPDNTSYPQWAVRLHTNTAYDNFTIYRSPAGGTASLAQLFQIDNAGNVSATGNVSAGHLIGNTTTPTITAGSAVSTTIQGNDLSGLISFTSPSTSVSQYTLAATVTFAKPFASTPNVLLTPASGVTMVLGTAIPYVDSANVGTTSFKIYYAAPPPTNYAMKFWYAVIG